MRSYLKELRMIRCYNAVCLLKGVEATGIEGDEQHMLRPSFGKGFRHLEHVQGERSTHHQHHAAGSVGQHQAWQSSLLSLRCGKRHRHHEGWYEEIASLHAFDQLGMGWIGGPGH